MKRSQPLPKTSGNVKGFAVQQRCYGRAGLPQEWLERLQADYQRLGSLARVAAAHGRTRQSVYQIFKRAGIARNPRPDAKPAVIYQGRKYSQDSNGYWRATVGRDPNRRLHHVIWVAANGPLPPGHKLVFKDGDKNNWQLANLELLSNSEQTRRHASGHNQFTRTAAARTSVLLQNFNCGGRTVTAQIRKAKS